ncbi:Nn.00g117840.m01.CDS01 [Neocucurbitaria sp. VM-36]
MAETTANYALKVGNRADTNRNGIIDISGKSDSFGKTHWTEARGAIFLPNIGDTNRRCSQATSKLSNDELGTCHDASDDIQRAPQYLAPLRTFPMADISDSATGNKSVPDPKQSPFVRIFHKQEGNWNIFRENDIFKAADLRNGILLSIDGKELVDLASGMVVSQYLLL